jgi:hypothetical protein
LVIVGEKENFATGGLFICGRAQQSDPANGLGGESRSGNPSKLFPVFLGLDLSKT